MKLSQRQIFILSITAIILAIVILVFYYNIRLTNQTQNTLLTFWGFDKPAIFESLIQGYGQLRPNVSIKYVQVDRNNYEDFLLNALASGKGPDIFPIRNRNLLKEINKLAPADPQQLNLVKLRELFPQVVEQDFTFTSNSSSTPGGKDVYALPLSLDTLALIYNKDLLDQAAVVSPPATWEEFQSLIPKLRSLNQSGQITRAAAAFGGSEKTIPRAADILNLLMLQNGTAMVKPDLSAAAFASSPGGPGFQAFDFYLQFANPLSSYYTWNDSQPNALDSFASGQTVMLFDYHSVLSALRSKNPFLNLGIAPMPQPANNKLSINYADYWGLAVSKQSASATRAWDFIIYLAANSDANKIYLEAANQPPALRSLIAQKLNDPEFGVFASQALTARSWTEIDGDAVENIFNNAISGVLSGQFYPGKALENAQEQITQLMQQR